MFKDYINILPFVLLTYTIKNVCRKHSPKVKICKRETHEYQALIRQTLTEQNSRKRERNKGGYLCRT